MNREQAIALANKIGFSASGIVEADKLEFRQDVRDMCAANRCNKYDKSWTCPPACGELEEIRGKALKFQWGIVLQTTGEMEDSFDVDAMTENERLQKERFEKYIDEIRMEETEILPMAVGACMLCEKCTYPDNPCRFPERAYPSVESYGLLVTDTCESAGVGYYYGPNTITFTSLVLIG